MELFAENAFQTVRRVADRLGVAFTTAQRAVDRLVGVGAVPRVGSERRNRLFCARAVLDVLEEPPRLAG